MKVLRQTQDGKLLFNCPGCDMWHFVTPRDVPGKGPRWDYNGDPEKPTFSPSVLVRYPWGDPPVDKVCHSFVKDGQIQFLGDCTHELAGKTVPLPVPEWD